MKKMLLMGMLVVSGLSFGRDYERRESQELSVIENVRYEDKSMLSREREISRENQVVYSEFHRDLENMERGTDRR